MIDRLLHLIKKIIPKKIFKKLQPSYHFLLAWLAAIFFGRPSEDMIVIGITGTTGKTTSAYIIAKMLEASGCKVGYTSTAMFNDGEKEWVNDKKMTMPGRFFAQKILRSMLRNGCRYAIVETTSEGIEQWRHRFINYDILIFTGLYPEHIDSHGSFDNYRAAKIKLFKHLKNCQSKCFNQDNKIVKVEDSFKKLGLNRIKKTIIANLDDNEANTFLDCWAEKKYGYYQQADSLNKNLKNIETIKYEQVTANEKGISFLVNNKKISLDLLGQFNATNAMTAVCLGLSQDLSLDKIFKGLSSIHGVPGRLEKIDEGQKFTVIVDYAFEPRALEKMYETLNSIKYKKIIHVLGSAGGGRDISRRPKLGKIAGEQADIVIVTNEDPYDDNPQIIIDQVAVGAEKSGKILEKDLFKILDRREAIAKALFLADDMSLVIITGKGNEQAICLVNGKKMPWDDRTVVREEIKKK